MSKFFGGINDPLIVPFPDPLMFGAGDVGIYDAANTNYSDLQYAIQTDIDSFNWASFDAMSNLCHANSLTRMWYGGYMGVAQNKWLGNFPSWTDAQIVQATTNFVAAAAARDSSIAYINICNEGVLDPTGYGGRFQGAFGGAGASGYDWVIAMAKIWRQYFPNAKLGYNDFGIETIGATDPRGIAVRNPQFVEATKALLAAGAIDWVGFEGYDLQQIATPDLSGALNAIGATGASVIMTEFSPDAYQQVSPQTVLSDWQRVLPIYWESPYTLGVLGPWGWRKSWSSWTGGTGWFVDDSVSPPVQEPVIAWLQSYLQNIPPIPPIPPVQHGYVQGTYACPQSPDSTVPVVLSGQTKGNANVAVIGWNDATSWVVSVLDSNGNTYAKVTPTVRGVGLSQEIWVAFGINVGTANLTVTFSGPVPFADVRFAEYGGVTQVGTSSSGAGTNASPKSTQPGELYISAVTTSGGVAAAAPGFTVRIITVPDGDLLADSPLPVSDVSVLSGSANWVSQLLHLSP